MFSVVQPGFVSSGLMMKLGVITRLPESAQAAWICAGVAGVLLRRKRETGSAVGLGNASAVVDTTATGRAKLVKPVPVGSVRLPVGSAESVVIQVEGPIGIVSMMVVVMIATLVRIENSVAGGQASEMVLFTGNNGTVLFNEALGVADGTVTFPVGSTAVEVISKDVVVGGRIVEMFPTEKEATVE